MWKKKKLRKYLAGGNDISFKASCIVFFRLHNLVTSRQQDKQNIIGLEKKLNEEKKIRNGVEVQLNSERKAKKAEEAAAARAVALATATSAQR